MSNILRPNLFVIGTSLTPEWEVSNGVVAKVTDAAGDQVISVAQGGKLDLDGALGANTIILQGLLASQVTAYRSGTEARFKLISTGETVLSLPVTTGSQTIRFADGVRVLQIQSGIPTFNSVAIASDSAAPSLLSAGLFGSELRLRFSEEMSGGGLPPASALQVVADGTALAAGDIVVAAAEGSTVFVTLPSSIASARTVTVAYTDPTATNDTKALQDINGNDVATFAPVNVTKNPADGVAPILMSAVTSSDGGRVRLEFSEELASSGVTASWFALTAAGAPVSVSSASLSGKFVELLLPVGAIAAGQAVKLNYSAGSAGALADSSGNPVASWSDWIVANYALGAEPVLAKPTNILRPNFYGIETTLTPNWKVSAGMVAKVTDASGAQTITVARGGKLDIDGALGANTFVLEGYNASQFEVYRSGTEARFRLVESGETVLSLPVTSTAQTIRFADGDRVLQIQSGAPTFNGVAIASDSAAPVFQRATVSGTELRLHFGEELNGAKLPVAGALTITVNGIALTTAQYTVQGVEGKQLLVLLTQAVTEQSVVMVSYADPSSNNDELAIQDINGNDALGFGPVRAVAPIQRVVLDDQASPGGPGNLVTLDVSAQAFQLIDDLTRTSNFEVSGYGVDDRIELTNLTSPSQLSISTVGADVSFVVNFGEGITSSVLIRGVVPEGTFVFSPASFNELAVGDLIGIDALRPSFADGASRSVSVTEGTSQLATVSATDTSGVSYSLFGVDASLLAIDEAGVVRLKTGNLDFDGANPKRTYSFGVTAVDSFSNDRVQSWTVQVLNDPADDPPGTDTTAPVFTSASTNSTGTKIILTYNEALSATTAGASAFNVLVAGSARSVSSVAVVGSAVELTLASAITSGQTVTVGYTDPTAGNDANAVQDVAGNDAVTLASTAVTNTVGGTVPDTTPPTVSSIAYGTNDGNLAVGEAVTLLVTMSEAVNVMGTPAIALANGGTATYVGGTGTSALTFSYTPAANHSSTGDLATAANSALMGTIQDLAGNFALLTGFNAVNPQGILAVDTVAPAASTVTESTTAAVTKDAVTFTVTFSEALTGTVGTNNFTATNGTVTSVTKVGDTNAYTVVVTPTPGVASGSVALSLVGGSLKDVAGNALANANLAGLASQAIDTLAPAITSAATVTVAENTSAAVYTAQATDLTAVAYSLSGSDAGLFNISTSTGAVTFKAAPNFEQPADAGANNVYDFTVVATDAAGNASQRAVALTVSNLNEAPTVAKPIADAVFVVGGAVDTFTVPSDAFADVDAGTTLTYSATLADGSALPAWLTFTAATRTFSGNPTADGSVTLRVTASDGALSVFDDFVLQSVSVADTTAPVFASASTNSTGTKIILTYNEALSATTAGASAFNVLVAGSSRSVSSVAVVGSAVELTLASAITSGQTVTVGYTDPTAGNDANAVQDLAGNDAVTLASTTVINTVGGTPPTTFNDIQVSNHYLEQTSGNSSLVRVVPTSVSASGLTLAVQLNSAIGSFDAVDLSFQFNSALLKENLAASTLNGTWSLGPEVGLAQDTASTLSMNAAALTPVNASSLPVLASMAFTWAAGVTGPVTTSGLRLNLILGNDTTKTEVLDGFQDLIFKPAILGGAATGTTGNDQFIIGGGDVVVTGGTGNDRFVPTTPTVNLTIQDFVSGTDKIDLGHLLSSAGYSSFNADALAPAQSGVLGNWTGQTLPTSTQIANRDPLLDNEAWLSYNSQTKRLDLFCDLLPNLNQVDIGLLSIQLGSASTGFGLSDLLLAPYSVSGRVID